MIKTTTLAATVLALTAGLAFAQTSQPQGGTATSPTASNAQTQPDAMKSNAKMKKKKTSMKKSGASSTTGMSSGGAGSSSMGGSTSGGAMGGTSGTGGGMSK